MQRPFVCHRPKLFDTPIIYNSPHSGRIYNSSFLGHSVLSFNEIRVSEDYYVDQLFQSATENGAFLLEACFPRSFVDVNRSPSELDQKLIAELSSTIMSPRTSAGLGVIPRIVGDGIEIYSEKLSLEEVKIRLNSYYYPYHRQLKKLIGHALEHFGTAILLDVHSMPHACLENFSDDKTQLPQIVIGDCFGSSCSPSFSQEVFDIFESEGFKVVRNSPFSGGFITKNYGVSHENVEVIQIEIDRSMYMNEKKLALHAGFFTLRKKLEKIVRSLAHRKREKSFMFQAAE